MARDRQRAKQRRNKRQAGAVGPSRAARARSARERRDTEDLGWTEEQAPDTRQPGGSTPVPGPLEHSSADVDEARLAEAGAKPPDVGEELPDELERAPDEVEGDLVP